MPRLSPGTRRIASFWLSSDPSTRASRVGSVKVSGDELCSRNHDNGDWLPPRPLYVFCHLVSWKNPVSRLSRPFICTNATVTKGPKHQRCELRRWTQFLKLLQMALRLHPGELYSCCAIFRIALSFQGVGYHCGRQCVFRLWRGVIASLTFVRS